jgi:UBX domain-containing protein 7
MDSTPEGRTFCERYQVHDYPHISIIDPRTGRLLWRKEGWTQQNALTADTFAEIAMDFCSRNSFDRPPQAPLPPNAAVATTATSTTPAKRMHEMSEDEQLQAAMQASITEAGGVTSKSDNNEIVYVDDSIDDDGADAPDEDKKPQAIDMQHVDETPVVSWNDELQSYVVPAEPITSSGNDISRIQFRTVDSKRVVRKFSSSDPVRAIYAFVAVRFHYNQFTIFFTLPFILTGYFFQTVLYLNSS